MSLIHLTTVSQVAKTAAQASEQAYTLGVGVSDLQRVHYHSIVVDLTKEVCLLQVVPRHLIVLWQVVPFTQA